jgi:SEC-C motif domain protein
VSCDEPDRPSPEPVMRARYAAYAAGDVDTVWRTWHPTTRPDRAELARSMDGSTVWTGLTVLSAEVEDEHTGWVEFEATYLAGGRPGRLRERSRFSWRASQWLYVEGDADWS